MQEGEALQWREEVWEGGWKEGRWGGALQRRRLCDVGRKGKVRNGIRDADADQDGIRGRLGLKGIPSPPSPGPCVRGSARHPPTWSARWSRRRGRSRGEALNMGGRGRIGHGLARRKCEAAAAAAPPTSRIPYQPVSFLPTDHTKSPCTHGAKHILTPSPPPTLRLGCPCTLRPPLRFPPPCTHHSSWQPHPP